MTAPRKYTRELLTEAVAASTSIAGVLRFLGLNQTGGSHSHLSRRIKALDLDTSHFRRGLPLAQHHARLSPEKILVVLADGARAKPHLLKRGLQESGRPYQCALCHCDGAWRGAPLTLEVDHIDGDYRNNTLSNLRFLCPNCHRQTPTFAGRGKGRSSSAVPGPRRPITGS